MSTINDIGIPGVGSGILQPKQKNRWRVTFANLGGGVDSQPVSMQATKTGRPHLKFENVALHRYNSIQDDVTGSASKVIQAQLQKQQWLIGAEGQWLAAAGEGSLYKFVIYLDMLDGNDQVIEKWTMEGCFLEDVDYGEVDYSTGDAVEISMSVRYDHARQNISGYNQGKGIATGGAGATT
jgi:hypothetical protein